MNGVVVLGVCRLEFVAGRVELVVVCREWRLQLWVRQRQRGSEFRLGELPNGEMTAP